MNIVVLFGGTSSEHDISCISAASVLRQLDPAQYQVYAVGITKEGAWRFYPDWDAKKVETGAWEQEKTIPCLISPDRTQGGLFLLHEDAPVERIDIDCVFPVLHGTGGEDGTVQGLLELAGLCYVGCSVATSANAMDKSITKAIVAQTGIRQARYALVHRTVYQKQPAQAMTQVIDTLGAFPMFVKPCSAGSSVGVSCAQDVQALQSALDEAFHWDSKVLVEEAISGQEIEVAVLGNDCPVASSVGEIAPTATFYTFDAKYHDDTSKLFIPAHITAEQSERTREAAIQIYRALGCTGLSRVDFFCEKESGSIVFNEINTMPGFTGISMYPKLFAFDGIDYPKLLDRLIALAKEAHACRMQP